MKDIARVDSSHEMYLGLKQTLRISGKLFLDIGYRLKVIRDEKRYMDLDYETFEHFINDSDIGLKRPTAYLYIRIYEYYIEQLEFKDEELSCVPITRLMRVLPALKKLENPKAQEIVGKLITTTTWDYEKIVQEEKLDESNRPTLIRDKETGKYVFVFNEDQILKIINKTKGELLFGTE